MDEAKRFIRYIFPGLSVVPQLLLFIYFYDKSVFSIFLDKETNSLGIIVTAFFATGILGYLFSSVYYVVHWWVASKLTKLNYIKIVTDERNAQLFKDYDTKGKSQSKAGSTMSVCWKMICDGKYIDLDKTERTFGNILHSIGTTIMIMTLGLFIGSIFLIANSKSINCGLLWYISISLFMLFFLCVNYWTVANMLQNYWEQSFNKIRAKNNKKCDKKQRKHP